MNKEPFRLLFSLSLSLALRGRQYFSLSLLSAHTHTPLMPIVNCACAIACMIYDQPSIQIIKCEEFISYICLLLVLRHLSLRESQRARAPSLGQQTICFDSSSPSIVLDSALARRVNFARSEVRIFLTWLISSLQEDGLLLSWINHSTMDASWKMRIKKLIGLIPQSSKFPRPQGNITVIGGKIMVTERESKNGKIIKF